MNDAVLGAKWSPPCAPMDQAVVPPTGLPSASVQSKAAPPQGWTSMPRWRLYQACSAGASFALKKIPPTPVTRFMVKPPNALSEYRLQDRPAVRDERHEEAEHAAHDDGRDLAVLEVHPDEHE